MRLLRLEVQGFKSFSDKITVSFVQDGVSIIVGPNGCGKSNIVDAIRWVLGEQSAKHLRGATMEDVIFNGSESRAPVSMAQVTLFFSNPKHDTLQKYSEFSEISVTRKLFRSGESSYLINKTPCRLADIRELFMDTGIGGKGYSIIEQGRIDLIVTSRPQDRRSIIDEAAGIVKFKTKRGEAIRKFDTSKDQLNRAQDIIAELEIQEKTLEKQVKEAQAYLEAKGRFERLTQELAAYKWYHLRQQANQFQTEREGYQARIEDLRLKNVGVETQKANLELNIAKSRTSLDSLRDLLNEQNRQAIRLESNLEADRRALADLEEWDKKGGLDKEELEERIANLTEQIETIAFDLDELADQITSVKDERAAIKERMEAQQAVIAQQEAHYQTLKKEELDLKSGRSGESEQITQLKERAEEAQGREVKLQAHLEQISQTLKDKEKAAEETQRALENKRELKDKAEERLASLKSQLANAEEEYEELDFRISELSKLHSQTESRLASIEEFLEGHEDFDQGAKTLLSHFVRHPEEANKLGFLGSLVDLIKPDQFLTEPIKAFLARHFNLLVFADQAKLKPLSELITKLGNPYLEFCFVNLSPSHAPEEDSLNQSIQWEANPVHLAKQIQGIALHLAALPPEYLTGPHAIMDPQGNLLTKEKIFCLGQKSAESRGAAILERRQELEELKAKADTLAQQVATMEEQEIAKKERLEELDNLLEKTQTEVVDLELAKVALDKEMHQVQADVNRLSTEKEAALQQASEAKAQAERFLEKIEQLRLGLAGREDKVEQLQRDIEKAEAALEEARLRKDLIQGQDQEKEVRLAGYTEKRENFITLQARVQEDILNLRQKLNDRDRQQEETEQRKKSLQEKLAQASGELPKLLARLKELEEGQKALQDEIHLKVAELDEFNKTIGKELKEMQDLKEKQHTIDIKLAQFAQEAKIIEENLFNELSIRPDEVLERFDPAQFQSSKVEQELRELKKILEKVEGINLAAKQEYDLLMERLNFLRQSYQDLINSIQALEQSIDEIDQETKKRFKETFKKVNDNFTLLFPKLFGGGSAHLRLTDPEDLLETGVEIIASPPGKKLQNMTLLSGGEKAMTAIALIFAIFQMKPSPFCLLDEVDAPLDDANNGRFNEHVKAMTANSQFIIITHNKKTMEIGDVMFGVTMEEPGTSKVVSVDFQEVDKKFLKPA